MALAILLASCSNNGGSGADRSRLTLAGGSMSGAWSAISEGVANTLRREQPGVAITHEVGLDGANAALVDAGRVQLGMLHSAMGRLALEGRQPYLQKHPNVRAISRVYSDSAYHFLVREESGITSLEEIKARRLPLRLSVMYRGSLMETASRIVLAAYGLTYEDIESWGGKVYFRALVPSLELMTDGALDALALNVQFPETNMNEASIQHRFRLLPISDAAIDSVNSKLGTYRTLIPGKTYRFAAEDVPTFSDNCVLIVNAQLAEQEVYNLTRALFKNLDYLHSVHRSMASLTPETMSQVSNIPLHPGAARFYREAGVL